MRVTVLGAGSWGTALAILLSRNGHEVTLYGRSDEDIEIIRRIRENLHYLQGFTIPALSTRRAESEIELKDGQSFGIAGLLDHRAAVQMTKVPGLGDIPILGQLFRSRSINRSNDELLVLVTPHIIDPVRSALPVPPSPKVVVPYLDDKKFDRKAPEQPKNAETPPQTPSAK